MSSPPDSRPTLKSLAEITGLGISTVSQALRGSPVIAEETRRRVQLAAQQAGYRPNRAGVRLRTGKSNVITVVLNPQDGGSGFFANIIYGISDALAGTSYHLVVTPYSLSDPMAPIRYIVETSSADGVIISRTQPDDPRVRYMIKNEMPFVTHGRTEMGAEHCYYDFDNEAYGMEAARLLHGRGRKALTLVQPPPTLTYFLHTQRGFQSGLEQFQMTHVPMASVSTDSRPDELRAAARELAKRDLPPDGIVCSSVVAAPAIAAGMLDAGLVLARDYDMVVKPATPQLTMTLPKLLSIDEDFHQAGRNLAEMLMARIDGQPCCDLQRIERPVVAPETLAMMNGATRAA
jgi:LacI family transcriptional regulator